MESKGELPPDEIIRVLRNPYDCSEVVLRQALLEAADLIEGRLSESRANGIALMDLERRVLRLEESTRQGVFLDDCVVRNDEDVGLRVRTPDGNQWNPEALKPGAIVKGNVKHKVVITPKVELADRDLNCNPGRELNAEEVRRIIGKQEHRCGNYSGPLNGCPNCWES